MAGDDTLPSLEPAQIASILDRILEWQERFHLVIELLQSKGVITQKELSSIYLQSKLSRTLRLIRIREGLQRSTETLEIDAAELLLSIESAEDPGILKIESEEVDGETS